MQHHSQVALTDYPLFRDYAHARLRLSKWELAELRAAQRRALNVREAYRVNAVNLLGNERTAADITNALPIDPDTVRTYLKRYKQGVSMICCA